ncbi:ABC transporter permease [Solihabitans fulvus]|uniref:ABC transporter permease n=1 Tax=Solihabitans fulvus TaxID=1892852 RepID=A0A5B2XHM5_9PSEU|nr:ABC transporter permease [Solihabitans fulvus]KAA2262569.1 ABC transporter permease [Solihabitans fulvus]
MRNVDSLAKPVRLGPVDLVLLGLLGVRTRPMRAVLSALGISIGIATMIVVVGIPASSQRALDDQLSTLGTNLLRAEAVLNPMTQKLPEVPEAAAQMAARIGPVELTSAVGNTHVPISRSDRIPAGEGSGLTVLASRLTLLPTIGARVHSGTFLNQANESFPTVVLGDKAATRLGITELRPGEPNPQVWIGAQWFTVVGVLDPIPLAPDVERSVLVGWETARAKLGFDGHPTVVFIRSQEAAIENVRSVLAATIFPANPAEIQVSRPSDALAAKRISQSTFSGLFLGLAGVALLVGGVGVANTMVISVLERKREIGLRRALGGNRRQVRGQFIAESVALCLLGGLAGAGLGTLGTAGYAVSRDWPTVIPLTTVLGGVGAAIAIGVLAGVYPAIRASRLTPTEALAAP